MEDNKTKEKRYSKRLIMAIVAVLVVLLATVVGISIYHSPARQLEKQLELGNRYLDEMDYEQAVIAFTKAIDIDPMSAEAYIGLTEAYIGQGEFELALETARKGYEATNDERLKEKIDQLESEMRKSEVMEEEVFYNGWKRTGYDKNGNIAWWHIITFDPDGRLSDVTAYNAAGEEIGTVYIEYEMLENGMMGGYTITNYGFDSYDGHIWPIHYVYEEVYLNPEEEEMPVEDEFEDYNQFEGHESLETMRKLLVRDEFYENTDGGTPSGYTLYEYDGEGKQTKTETYTNDGTLEEYCDLEFNDKGELIRRDYYRNAGDEYQLDHYQIYERDENGDCPRYETYDAEGTLLDYTIHEPVTGGRWLNRNTKFYDGEGNLRYEESE